MHDFLALPSKSKADTFKSSSDALMWLSNEVVEPKDSHSDTILESSADK